MSVRLYLHLCCGRTASEFNEEEGSYASRFCRWFLESFKSCLLHLVAHPGLNDTLAQFLLWRSLLWFSVTSNERTWHRVISSAQHRWPDLWYNIYCFVQSRETFTVEGNTHTHAHAHTHTRAHTHTHTHTHTYTHTDKQQSFKVL